MIEANDEYTYIYIYIQMFSFLSRAFGNTFLAQALRPLGLEYGLKTLHLPCSGHLGAQRGCSSLHLCTWGARMGCSSPLSVPPRRSKVLLEPQLSGPRALEGAARASIWCPRALKGAAPASTRCHRCARRGCSSLLGAPCARTTGH